MGEARRRAQAPVTVIYHHTSQIRLNLIYMSGVIALEGQSKGAEHPMFGEVCTDVMQRRACKDFPPLAWFTSSTTIPKCLLNADLRVYSKADGSRLDIERQTGMSKSQIANFISLKRFAFGFPNDPAIFTPWVKHHGYHTAEGRELNETARDAGDDPNRWFVSETPVDLLRSTEVWGSSEIMTPRLKRSDEYLKGVHRLVSICRSMPGTIIPPSWTGDPAVEPMLRERRLQEFGRLGPLGM